MRIVIAAGMALILGACTNAGWEHTFAFLDAPKPAPAPAPAVRDPEWCSKASQAAAREAADQGFDQATQARRAQLVFAQCAQKS